MSKEGIKKVAKLISNMQELRIELIGSMNKQDIFLAQMILKGHEAMKDRFIEILLQKEDKK